MVLDSQSDQQSPSTPAEQEERERQRSVLEQNLAIMKELEHREIVIRSNRYDEEDREYYVEKVERTYLDGTTGNIPAVRLVNEGVRPSLQPVLKMPRGLIPIDESQDRRTLKLIYSHEPTVEQSFHYMNRYERPDLEIYISHKI